MLNDCPQVSFGGRGQHHWQGALFPGRRWEKGAQGELCLLGAEHPATTSGIQSVPNFGTPSVGPALVQGPVWVPAGCHTQSKLHLSRGVAIRATVLLGTHGYTLLLPRPPDLSVHSAALCE